MDLKKIYSITLVTIAILNLILFAMRLIDTLVFWGIIILLVIYVYFLMPKIR